MRLHEHPWDTDLTYKQTLAQTWHHVEKAHADCQPVATVSSAGLSPLRAANEGYLRAVGFLTYEHDTLGTLWGHPELGQGRTFDDALRWWMGHEERARG